MTLTNRDILELTEWRRDMHRHPEVSRQEQGTAKRVNAALAQLSSNYVVTGLGGHGIAAVFDGDAPGPTVMFRAELDALPITEISTADHRSTIPGIAHLCGHDGHMTLLLGLGRLLARRRPVAGRVILMFQPAEEDGSGARAVVNDPRYADLRPDWAFAIHNWPGVAVGKVLLAPGVVNCASLGLKIILTGKTAHASQPDMGTSPALALSRLIAGLMALGKGGALDENFRLVTVTHATLGAQSFGIAPGEGALWVTLRTLHDAQMSDLLSNAMALATNAAANDGLTVTFTQHDHFAASVNHPDAVAVAARALDALGVGHSTGTLPERASEDFGVFGWGQTKSAMLFLGAGASVAALHNPDYDYPDDLTPLGVAIFERIARDLTGGV